MGIKQFVLLWNNRYPLDRWFRKRYSVTFNSQEHRKSNLLDVYFEFLEESVFEKSNKNLSIQKQKEDKYKKNGWLQERSVKFEEINLNDQDLSLFDEHDQ
jgi:hypothetical protein